VKWGHLVYLSNGPVLLIRAEENRVLFGFWRGQRLSAIEPRLKRGGKYEMATLELREGMTINPATARRKRLAHGRSSSPASVTPPISKHRTNSSALSSVFWRMRDNALQAREGQPAKGTP